MPVTVVADQRVGVPREYRGAVLLPRPRKPRRAAMSSPSSA
jgi:hypothetical protein